MNLSIITSSWWMVFCSIKKAQLPRATSIQFLLNVIISYYYSLIKLLPSHLGIRSQNQVQSRGLSRFMFGGHRSTFLTSPCVDSCFGNGNGYIILLKLDEVGESDP